MNAETLGFVREFCEGSELNRLPDQFGGGRFFGEPLIGVAAGNDSIFERFKEVVAPEHMTPAEAWVANGLPGHDELAARLRVVAVVFPFSAEIREAGARNETAFPPEVYSVARNYANAFIDAALEETARFFESRGLRATVPIHSPGFRVIRTQDPFRIYSTWSERHIAFAAALGTFSLHEGLITEVGCNVRFGSLVTDAPLEVTPRVSDEPYANCLHYAQGTCGACIANCPGGALTEHGHDKGKCRDYGGIVGEEMVRRRVRSVLKPDRRVVDGKEVVTYSVGCALCQFGVPCMDRNPTRDSGQ